MVSTIMTLVFRYSAIISGILLLILSIMIYRKTRNATKGWFFLSMFGVSLFLWSSTAMGLKGDALFLPRMLTGIVFLLCIAFSVSYSYSKLVEDFLVDKKRWINAKIASAFVGISFLAILIFNLIFRSQDFSSFLLPKLLSVSHWTVGLSFLFAIIPSFLLFKTSKEWRWGTAFLACLIIGLGMNLGQYYDGCCGNSGQLSEDAVCSAYDLDYMLVYNVGCSEGIVGIGKFYQLFLLVGIILLDTSFFIVWRSLD